MLDIQYIRENKDLVSRKSKEKGYNVDILRLLELDSQRRQLTNEVQQLQQQANELAAARKGTKPSPEQIEQGKTLKQQVAAKEQELKPIFDAFIKLFEAVPNMPLDTVPVGASEAENQVTKTVGTKPEFDFKPKNHAQIAEAKGWLDKQRAAKVAGSRFTYVKGDLVKLQFAIIQFVMDKLTDQQFIDSVIAQSKLTVSNRLFTPILPPYMIKTGLYKAMDRLEPQAERYKIDSDDLWLQGSAEHVIGSMYSGETLPEDELPLRYIGYATSFRREAGTYGKDMEGMFRMHQFDKLEMESFTTPNTGLQEHLFLIAIQEQLMQLLRVPYQVLTKCTADIGKPNASGVDIEAWLPGQNKYRETHTADYMTDYQARRLQTKFRTPGGKTDLVHTNDATALPLSRGPIAIIENYQTKEGDVVIPEVLRPYIGGKERL